jgi:hypothetical protein
VLGQIKATDANSQRAGRLLCRPLFKTVNIENLELFRIDLAFDP